jgi:lipoyl-dependent peroxiredoxin
MGAISTGTASWQGGLADGSGTTSTESGVLSEVEVSWPRRVERTGDTTSPEELIAAAHAACYCMGLAHELDQADSPPESLETKVAIEFVGGEGIKSSRIEVEGRVPGIDADRFEQAAQAAAEGCPVSAAMKGNVELSVEATLES